MGRDPQLDAPPIPEGFGSWFTRFLDMRTGERLTYADIDAYQRVTGCSVSPVQLKALFAMDRAAASALREIMEASKDGN